MPFRKPNNDNFILLALFIALFVALTVEDGLSKGAFVYAGLLQMLAAMFLAGPILTSTLYRRWNFGKTHLFVAFYAAAYIGLSLALGWPGVWLLTAAAAAVSTVVVLVMVACRWLGWVT